MTVSAALPEVVDIISLASDDARAEPPAAPEASSQAAPARRSKPRRPPAVVPVQVAIDADGQLQTEVIPLEGRATMSMGSDVGLVAGGTTHYRHPTLRVPATMDHGPFCCRLALPIRARHSRLGEGYLGLVAHIPRQRKSKPVFLSFAAAVRVGRVFFQLCIPLAWTISLCWQCTSSVTCGCCMPGRGRRFGAFFGGG